MKVCGFAIIFVALIATTSGEDEWVAGMAPVRGRAVTEYSVDIWICNTAANGAKFCNTSPGCSNTGYFQCFNHNPLPAINCSGSTPYCNGGSCVAVPPAACEQPFVCPGPGYFPKYDDCYSYYYCYYNAATNSFVATKKVCPSGYPFNPLGPQDRLCLKGGQCVTNKCSTGKIAEWVAFNYTGVTQDQIALYCVDGRPIRVDACSPGLSIDVKNLSSRSCQLRCLENYQTAVYDNDSNSFYVCRDGIAYVDQCDVDHIFDGKTFSCVYSPTSG